jgi:hypothetical protein
LEKLGFPVVRSQGPDPGSPGTAEGVVTGGGDDGSMSELESANVPAASEGVSLDRLVELEAKRRPW